MTDVYEPLTPESLPARLSTLESVSSRLGTDHTQWSVSEIGDGNLNLVFIVSGGNDSVIVKQALPYVRLVGDSWPLPLYRAFYENCALTRQASRTSNAVPDVFHFDEQQALIVMEHLRPHVILRNKLINGEYVSGLGHFVGKFFRKRGNTRYYRGSGIYRSIL